MALAHLYFAGGRYPECLAAAERGAEAARAIGDDRLLAAAEMRQGTVLGLTGRSHEGIEALESSARLAEAAGDLDVLSLAVSNLGETYVELGELERGRANIERSLHMAQRVGELASMGYSQVMIGWILYYQGEWGKAEAFVTRGAEVIHSVGSSWYSAYPPLQLGRLRLAQGAWIEAARSLEECVAIAGPIGDIQALQGAHRLLGELEVLQGHPEAACARLEPLAGSEPTFDLIGLLATLAWAQLDSGLVIQADVTADKALDLARVRKINLVLPEALRVRAMVCGKQERWNEAQADFEQAVSVARALPYPYGEARALYAWGVLDIGRRKAKEARERLDRALTIFQRLGAMNDAERTRQELRRLEALSPHRKS